jgi:hypothetical protein
VYEWAPGGFFVVHPAYGRIGDIAVGGVEIIGYDPANQKYKVYFFDSQGNISRHDLTIQDRSWIWQGKHTRCTGVFSEDGKTQTAPPRTHQRRRKLGPLYGRHPEKGRISDPAQHRRRGVLSV